MGDTVSLEGPEQHLLMSFCQYTLIIYLAVCYILWERKWIRQNTFYIPLDKTPGLNIYLPTLFIACLSMIGWGCNIGWTAISGPQLSLDIYSNSTQPNNATGTMQPKPFRSHIWTLIFSSPDPKFQNCDSRFQWILLQFWYALVISWNCKANW